MSSKRAFLGAAFLMATSAVGPGFLTQTSMFTAEMLASFGFVILISLLLDLAAQLNIWRIITQRGERAQDMANSLFPGLGYLLAALIAFGGLAFNVGNIGGTGLGLNVLMGWPPDTGALVGCAFALFIFWQRSAARLMDIMVTVLGLAMIGLTIYVAYSSRPPLVEAVYRSFWPQTIDFGKIITIVGGTVGGYISFAGAHRLLDAGMKGPENIKPVTVSAVNGILLTSTMRFILFLAILGVVSNGATLASGNPAASAFRQAAGSTGYYFFGLVLWIASITSVIGASYTTISFWKTLSPFVAKNEKWVITIFILASTAIFYLFGKPVSLLVTAGTINGFILPIALALILLAATLTPKNGYKHSGWLLLAGWLVVILLGTMSVAALI